MYRRFFPFFGGVFNLFVFDLIFIRFHARHDYLLTCYIPLRSCMKTGTRSQRYCPPPPPSLVPPLGCADFRERWTWISGRLSGMAREREKKVKEQAIEKREWEKKKKERKKEEEGSGKAPGDGNPSIRIEQPRPMAELLHAAAQQETASCALPFLFRSFFFFFFFFLLAELLLLLLPPPFLIENCFPSWFSTNIFALPIHQSRL